MLTKNRTRTALVQESLSMFAATGVVCCNAFLYNKAEAVQLKAAPKAASSPIIVSHSLDHQILFEAVKYLTQDKD
jgi:hypothetical protein